MMIIDKVAECVGTHSQQEKPLVALQSRGPEYCAPLPWLQVEPTQQDW